MYLTRHGGREYQSRLQKVWFDVKKWLQAGTSGGSKEVGYKVERGNKVIKLLNENKGVGICLPVAYIQDEEVIAPNGPVEEDMEELREEQEGEGVRAKSE